MHHVAVKPRLEFQILSSKVWVSWNGSEKLEVQFDKKTELRNITVRKVNRNTKSPLSKEVKEG